MQHNAAAAAPVLQVKVELVVVVFRWIEVEALVITRADRLVDCCMMFDPKVLTLCFSGLQGSCIIVLCRWYYSLECLFVFYVDVECCKLQILAL